MAIQKNDAPTSKCVQIAVNQTTHTKNARTYLTGKSFFTDWGYFKLSNQTGLPFNWDCSLCRRQPLRGSRRFYMEIVRMWFHNRQTTSQHLIQTTRLLLSKTQKCFAQYCTNQQLVSPAVINEPHNDSINSTTITYDIDQPREMNQIAIPICYTVHLMNQLFSKQLNFQMNQVT